MDNILIVDGNTAFATVLKETLERDGGYQATVVSNGGEALRALDIGDFDLAIVDLGLSDPDGVSVVRELRRRQADLAVMVIPAGDDGVPAGLQGVPLQGVLSMPFFFPDLPARIAEALRSARAVGSGGAAADQIASGVRQQAGAALDARAPKPTERRVSRAALSGADLKDAVRRRAAEIARELNILVRDINADAALLTQGSELLAHTGRLAAEDIDRLAQAVEGGWRIAEQVAQVLGRHQGRFEQSTEGGEYLLYSVAVAENLILSVALSSGVPLGMVRHRAKDVADALRALVGAA